MFDTRNSTKRNELEDHCQDCTAVQFFSRFFWTGFETWTGFIVPNKIQNFDR